MTWILRPLGARQPLCAESGPQGRSLLSEMRLFPPRRQRPHSTVLSPEPCGRGQGHGCGLAHARTDRRFRSAKMYRAAIPLLTPTIQIVPEVFGGFAKEN